MLVNFTLLSDNFENFFNKLFKLDLYCCPISINWKEVHIWLKFKYKSCTAHLVNILPVPPIKRHLQLYFADVAIQEKSLQHIHISQTDGGDRCTRGTHAVISVVAVEEVHDDVTRGVTWDVGGALTRHAGGRLEDVGALLTWGMSQSLSLGQK